MAMDFARLTAFVRRPELLVFLPALAVPLLWIGGQGLLLAFAVSLPPVLLVARRLWPDVAAVPISDQVIARLDALMQDGDRSGGQSGCFVVQFDDPFRLCNRVGRTRQSEILAASIGRTRGALRPGDVLFALEDGSLAVVLSPSQRLDLAGMVRIAGRLQIVVQQPMDLADGVAQVTCCIGFCLADQVPDRSGRSLLEAAQLALDEARRHGPGAIRAYTADLAQARAHRDALRAAFPDAVETGRIVAHFQPQLSTDSGEISGLEVLARWQHPDHGTLMPGQFLPALDGTGLIALLGREMLKQALDALVAWDRAGLRVPRVAVNLDPAELADPDLPDRLVWALDARSLSSSRLAVEVLESVIAGGADDIVARNLSRIADLGCGVDLDDFGTGNTSIATIRRFALQRLKIDRSFIRNIDTDRDQQALTTAILSLAERLGLDCLAEGVETQGEHAMLAQLGCGHVQGYGIARPMPFAAVAPWVVQYRKKMSLALRIGVRAR